MITVFNVFTSNSRYSGKMPQLDILIWAASLVRHHMFGYRTKIYCRGTDIPFLKRNALYDLYDEIDTDFLENNERLSMVDDSLFWSTRKIEVIFHEWIRLGHRDAIYCDTDILMRTYFDQTGDALVWSPEDPSEETSLIYPSWDALSKPDDYVMPSDIAHCGVAFNCGVLWIKDEDVIRRYYDEYYRFAIGNPGLVNGEKPKTNNTFACNGEQRILRGILDGMGKSTHAVMYRKNRGMSPQGSHYYWYRIAWRVIGKKDDLPPDVFQCLNDTAIEALMACKLNGGDAGRKAYEKFSSWAWLKGFEKAWHEGNRLKLKKYY